MAGFVQLTQRFLQQLFRRNSKLAIGYYSGLIISVALLVISLQTFQGLFNSSSESIDKILEKVPSLDGSQPDEETSSSNPVQKPSSPAPVADSTPGSAANRQPQETMIRSLEIMAISRVLSNAMTARVAMANSTLALSGIYLGLSFAFLGLSLFLLGFQETMSVRASGTIAGPGSPADPPTSPTKPEWNLQILKMTPGAFAFLCGTIIVSLAVTTRAKLTISEGVNNENREDAPYMAQALQGLRTHTESAATNPPSPANMPMGIAPTPPYSSAPAACAPNMAPVAGGTITIPVTVDGLHLRIEKPNEFRLVPDSAPERVSAPAPVPPEAK